jgi:hypothetical protein
MLGHISNLKMESQSREHDARLTTVRRMCSDRGGSVHGKAPLQICHRTELLIPKYLLILRGGKTSTQQS